MTLKSKQENDSPKHPLKRVQGLKGGEGNLNTASI